MRAWRAADRLQARAALKSWLYRIASNVCFDMLQGAQRRAQPMDLGPPSDADARARPRPARARLGPADRRRARAARPAPTRPRSPTRARRCGSPSWPRSSTCRRASAPCSSCARSCAGRPPRSPSCSRRASPRSTARCSGRGPRSRRSTSTRAARAAVDAEQQELLARYVDAFERYDITSLVSLLHEDADVLDAAVPAVAVGAPTRSGASCSGRASIARARGCWRRRPTAGPPSAIYHPAAGRLRAVGDRACVEMSDGRIAGLHHFLYPELFAEFGLPPRLER